MSERNANNRRPLSNSKYFFSKQKKSIHLPQFLSFLAPPLSVCHSFVSVKKYQKLILECSCWSFWLLRFFIAEWILRENTRFICFCSTKKCWCHQLFGYIRWSHSIEVKRQWTSIWEFSTIYLQTNNWFCDIIRSKTTNFTWNWCINWEMFYVKSMDYIYKWSKNSYIIVLFY